MGDASQPRCVVASLESRVYAVTILHVAARRPTSCAAARLQCCVITYYQMVCDGKINIILSRRDRLRRPTTRSFLF